jgi:dTDP-4-dehydrorhamnose reductase
VSPTFVPDLCHAVLDLLIDGETGLWHVVNQGAISWHDFALALADRSDLDRELIFACEGNVRRNTALASMRATLLRPFEAALDDYLRDIRTAPPSGVDAEPAVHSAAAIMAT